MKPLPAGFPPANSRKWHSRRWWDPLGYLRVRSLGNPVWDRDTRFLAGWLRRERDQADVVDRGLYDQACAAVRRYPYALSGVKDPEIAWDEVLDPIDELVVRRQDRHMESVRLAQRGEPDD